MAEYSKSNINGIPYDIKDAKAREKMAELGERQKVTEEIVKGLTTLPPGSSGATDAEVVAARVDGAGITYDNLGDAMRAQVPKSAIVNEVGDSEKLVMSQKATGDFVNKNLNFQNNKVIQSNWYRKTVYFYEGIATPEYFSDSTTRLLNRTGTQTDNYLDITGRKVTISVEAGYRYACSLYRNGSLAETYHHVVLKDADAWKYYTEATTWEADGDYKYLLIMLAKTDNSDITLEDSEAIKIEEVIDIRNDVKDLIERLYEKFGSASIVQALGDSEDALMSQKAVTNLTYHSRDQINIESLPISSLLQEGYYSLRNTNLASDVPTSEFGYVSKYAILRNEVFNGTVSQTLYMLRGKTYFRTVIEGQAGDWYTAPSAGESLYNYGQNSMLGELAPGFWNTTNGAVFNESNFELNSYITKRPVYLSRATLHLADNVLVKVVKVNESGGYISDSGWMSVNATDFSAGGVTSYDIVDSYVYIVLANTVSTWNEAGIYTLSAGEMISRVKLVVPSVKTDASSSKLSGKKWLFIGDSITEHNFRASKNYDEYLEEWLNIVPVNVGMSGTGVTYPFGGNPSWLDKMVEYPADVDVISVMGALNDRHTALGAWGDRGINTVYGAVWNYFNNLINKYPNKPIVYITSTPRDYSYGEDGEFTAWVDAFIKTAHNFSIPVLDLYRNSGLRPWNAINNAEFFSCSESPAGDGVHPNEKGQRLMALKIAEFANQYLVE